MDYNPYKWPYNWGNWSYFTPISGGITLLLTGFLAHLVWMPRWHQSRIFVGWTMQRMLRLECFSLQSRGTTQAFWLQTKSILRLDLGGETSNIFKVFLECSPRKLRKISNLTSIFFKWVGSTTNQIWFWAENFLSQWYVLWLWMPLIVIQSLSWCSLPDWIKEKGGETVRICLPPKSE